MLLHNRRMISAIQYLRLVLFLLFTATVSAEEFGTVILQYHHVDTSTPAITSISIDDFRSHLDYLSENDYYVQTARELISTLSSDNEIPDKRVSITFDDAYKSIYTNAYPLLKQKRFPFTIFVTTDLIGRRHYLSADQLREMQQHGATIANHTHSHTHLLRMKTAESNDAWLLRVKAEIEQAQAILESEFGETPRLLAYPYGEYNQQVLDLVGQMGFVGFGQQSGAAGKGSSLLVLPRFPLSGIYTDLNSFRLKIRTLPMPLHVFPVLDPQVSEPMSQPTLSLQFKQGNFRLHQLSCYGPGGLTDLRQLSATEFIARSKVPVPVGRSRYNCTMPVNNSDRFYWFSQLWIRKNDDGTWYPEL